LSGDVRAVVPYQPEWKISTDLMTKHATSEKSELIFISVIDETDLLPVGLQMKRIHGVTLKYVGGRDIVAEMHWSNIRDVSLLEGVEWIQRMPIFVTFDFSVEPELTTSTGAGYTGYESGTKLMNTDAAWGRGLNGANQILGMSDTGVDTGNINNLHGDLRGIIRGYTLGIGSNTWEDPNGHGTHVCGSVIGSGAMSEGNIRGGAFEAKFVAQGLWSPIVDNISFNPDFNTLLGTPYKNDFVRIHTNSWGSPRDLGVYDSFAAKVDAFLWNNPDMLVLFAAGNSGEDADRDGRIDEGSIGSPGTAKNVLTVGASENYLLQGGVQKPLVELRDGDKKWGVEPLRSDKLSDNAEGIAAFSSRGPTQDGRLKPEIVAPGTNIVSARSRHPKATELWGKFDENYLYAGGTSMSTPLSAGGAALARQYLIRDRNIKDPSSALLKALLLHTAKDLYPGQYGTGPSQELSSVRPNFHEGYGRLDADKATDLGPDTMLIDDKRGVADNEEKQVEINVPRGKGLRATLVYTDAPASASAAKALVNDVDLIVEEPAGRTFTKDDHINNSEMVEIHGSAGGKYLVVVKGINIPNGKKDRQPYALIVGITD
ncbi:MAG: S8 family serine peptidase, partial [Bdellovibrionota bacterium]